MPRSMMSLTLVISLAVLWSVGNVQAFTWRMGSVEVTQAPFEFLQSAPRDLPTPQFFRLVIDDRTGTIIVEEPYVRPLIRAVKPRLKKGAEISFPGPPPSERNALRPMSNELSGVETMLLRSAETVVESSRH